MPRALTGKIFKSASIGFLIAASHGLAHYIFGASAVFEAGIVVLIAAIALVYWTD